MYIVFIIIVFPNIMRLISYWWQFTIYLTSIPGLLLVAMYAF